MTFEMREIPMSKQAARRLAPVGEAPSPGRTPRVEPGDRGERGVTEGAPRFNWEVSHAWGGVTSSDGP